MITLSETIDESETQLPILRSVELESYPALAQLDAELVRVSAVTSRLDADGEHFVLAVSRGAGGSTPAGHAAGTEVIPVVVQVQRGDPINPPPVPAVPLSLGFDALTAETFTPFDGDTGAVTLALKLWKEGVQVIPTDANRIYAAVVGADSHDARGIVWGTGAGSVAGMLTGIFLTPGNGAPLDFITFQDGASNGRGLVQVLTDTTPKYIGIIDLASGRVIGTLFDPMAPVP